MSLWAIEKSPLIIGAPMNTSITPQSSLDILSNPNLIALNQDPLAEQAALVRRYTEEQYDIWAGNLSAGRKIVAITNWSNDTNAVTVDLASALGVSSIANITDVWAQEAVDATACTVNASLAGHEARLLLLEGITYTPAVNGTYYSAADATLTGAANLISCSGAGNCYPTGQKVQDVINGATLTFSNISIPDGTSTHLVGMDFINYDIALPTGTNTRNLTVAVNGGTAKRWAFPISGGNWTDTGRLNIEVDGFEMGSGNTVVLGALQGQNGTDFVGMEVY